MSKDTTTKAAPAAKTIDERRAEARAFRRRETGGVVQGADPKLHYSVFFTSDFAPSVCDQQRDALTRRGYEPCNGPRYKGEPRSEYVPDRPSAEIWACPLEIRDDEWRDSLLDCLRDPQWFRAEARKPESRSISARVLSLGDRYHRLLRVDGKAAEAAWAELEAHVLNTPVVRLGSKQE